MAGKESPLSSLADLGRALAETADNQEKSSEIQAEILELLEKLPEDDAKALFRNEAVQHLVEVVSDNRAQASDDPPGTVYPGMIGGIVIRSFTKKEFTESDLRKRIAEGSEKFTTFTPNETIDLIYNGIARHVVTDEEATVENCFYQIYLDRKQALRDAREHAAFLFRQRATAPAGMISPEGVRARAAGGEGFYKPGAGPITMNNAPPEAGSAS